MGQEIERFLCLLLHLQIYGLYCPLQIRHLDLDLLRVGYWVLFPYVTNFTVTKVIICFQLNLKTEKGCITLLSSKQPSSAHPSSHDVLQMTVSTVQCSNIREFWNFSFCNWKFGLLRRLNKIQRSFQKKNITKAHSIYHNCHLERNSKTKGEGVDQPLPLSVSTSMMGGGGGALDCKAKYACFASSHKQRYSTGLVPRSHLIWNYSPYNSLTCTQLSPFTISNYDMSVLGMYTFVMMMQHISDRTFFEEKSAIEKKKMDSKEKKIVLLHFYLSVS